MSIPLKRRYNVGVGREASRGTKQAAAMWLRPTVLDFIERSETVDTPRSMGIIEDSEERKVVKNFSQGKIGGEVLDRTFGYFLLAGLGSVASVETDDSGVYAHTFSVLQSSQHPSLTLEMKRGDIEQVAYPLCVLESLMIEAAVNDYVKFEAALRGKKAVAATGTPAYVEENVFLSKHISVKLAANYAGLGAASASDVRNIKLEVVKNVEDKDLLNSGEPGDFLNRQLAITGTMEVYFDSVYLRDYALDGDVKAMRIEMTNDDVIIGATSNPNLQINLAKVQFGEPSESTDNNDMVKVVVSFKGFYSKTDSKSIEAVLTNTKADYSA